MMLFFFFFFKQKTAYEMRISDWSSTCALPISTIRTRTGSAGRPASSAGEASSNNVTTRPYHASERKGPAAQVKAARGPVGAPPAGDVGAEAPAGAPHKDRKSTRLNSSH